LPWWRSPKWSIVGRGELYCSYTTDLFFGRPLKRIVSEKILHVRPAEAQQ